MCLCRASTRRCYRKGEFKGLEVTKLPDVLVQGKYSEMLPKGEFKDSEVTKLPYILMQGKHSEMLPKG